MSTSPHIDTHQGRGPSNRASSSTSSSTHVGDSSHQEQNDDASPRYVVPYLVKTMKLGTTKRVLLTGQCFLSVSSAFKIAWNHAFRQHNIRLTEEQKHTLEEGSSPQDVLTLINELSEHQRKGVRYRISRIIKPFIEGLKRFEGALNTLSQISPVILGSLWGAVKILLVVRDPEVSSRERLVPLLPTTYVGNLDSFWLTVIQDSE